MGWTDIAGAAIDAESPITETLVTALRDNGEYNFDNAVRGGTHLAGVRLAIARGTYDFLISLSSGDGQTNNAFTFAADADDGDPNFSATPVVLFTLEERQPTPANDSDWYSDQAEVLVWVDNETLSSSGFTANLQCKSGSSKTYCKGTLHWVAFGAVTSGE